MDRRPTDDGDHFIAARFGGPSDNFNHPAQDANFNVIWSTSGRKQSQIFYNERGGKSHVH